MIVPGGHGTVSCLRHVGAVLVRHVGGGTPSDVARDESESSCYVGTLLRASGQLVVWPGRIGTRVVLSGHTAETCIA